MAMQSMSNGHKQGPNSPPKLGEGVMKVVVMGAPQVGKTSFIQAYYQHHEPGEIDSHNGVRWYPCEFAVNDEYGRGAIFEIPSDPAFSIEQRRPHYEDARVIVLMYAIDDPQSLEMVRNKWFREAEEMIHLKGIPVVLIGNKKDLRDDPQVIERLALDDEEPLTYDKGKDLLINEEMEIMEEWNFCEISTNDVEEVNATFELIFTCGLY